MSSQKPTGPAQADHIDQKEGQRSPDPSKGQAKDTKTKEDDMPGADGQRSAGANEDTYD